MTTVLFACVHNAGRSQMAAAFFSALVDPSIARGISAGTEPAAAVHPVVVEVMKEAGIDLSGAKPQRITTTMSGEVGFLVTMGCGDVCPTLPGVQREDWPLEDPKGKPPADVRRIRDDIRGRVIDLVRRRFPASFRDAARQSDERNTTMDMKEIVREKYGQAARGESNCCGGSCGDPISGNLYDSAQAGQVPKEALQASLGCGNPTALAPLNPGETVLDLGSGGGIDVLLSARRVGPTGKAYGLDMTDEMLALARENQRKAGVTNVEFLKGDIEKIPLPDNSVDVVISNCVINLSTDKDRVLREAFRVLKPGGRLAVSDVVVRGPVPAEIRKNVELWIGCIAGALEESEYRDKLLRAGFQGVTLETTRVYDVKDAADVLAKAGLDAKSIAAQVDGKFTSAFIRAVKP